MRICIYTDPHWSQYSSILRSHGAKYSTRLEGLIKSVSWVEQTAVEHECDSIICLGDFFDSSNLNSEEITALNEVQWSDISHVVLVGNHEMGVNTLERSSAHVFNLLPRTKVIDQPIGYFVDKDETEICFLPYVLERNRLPLVDYFGPKHPDRRRIIFSHNDIKGIPMGQFISQEGFTIEEIESGCDVFYNGHLHNGSLLGNIFNLGNLTGQNFSEDASRYKHKIHILDTETLLYEEYVNPHAFNFLKIEVENITDGFTLMTTNNVLSIKVPSGYDVVKLRDELNSNPDVLEYRVIEYATLAKSEDSQTIVDVKTLDHVEQFKQYIMENVSTDAATLHELSLL